MTNHRNNLTRCEAYESSSTYLNDPNAGRITYHVEHQHNAEEVCIVTYVDSNLPQRPWILQVKIPVIQIFETQNALDALTEL